MLPWERAWALPGDTVGGLGAGDSGEGMRSGAVGGIVGSLAFT